MIAYIAAQLLPHRARVENIPSDRAIGDKIRGASRNSFSVSEIGACKYFMGYALDYNSDRNYAEIHFKNKTIGGIKVILSSTKNNYTRQTEEIAHVTNLKPSIFHDRFRAHMAHTPPKNKGRRGN